MQLEQKLFALWHTYFIYMNTFTRWDNVDRATPGWVLLNTRIFIYRCERPRALRSRQRHASLLNLIISTHTYARGATAHYVFLKHYFFFLIGHLRSLRLLQHYPLRGQGTRTNARTRHAPPALLKKFLFSATPRRVVFTKRRFFVSTSKSRLNALIWT